MRILISCLYCLCFLASWHPLAPAFAASKTRPDSLMALGRAQFKAEKEKHALKSLEEAAELDPDGVQTHLKLGHIYLEAGHLNRAMKAFKKALQWDDASAEAQAGIAEVHLRMASRGLASMFHSRKAVSAARRATRLDPDYAPAYLLLGRCYERLNENYAAAMRAYKKALDLQPDNVEAARRLGMAYIEFRRQPRRDRNISRLLLDEDTLKRLERHMGEPEFLPIAAQIYLDLGEAQKALETFERYIKRLPPKEQAIYRDLSAVATKAELEAYRQITDEERLTFFRQFWARRDLDLLTEVNERLFEHYRRVWYARKHFGQKITPWDSRGEIYVRYGDPDYRARSGQAPPPMSPAVEQVKERLALALHGVEAMDEVFIGPVYPVRSSQSFVGVLNPAALERWDEGKNVLGEDVYLDEAAEGAEDDAIPTMEENALKNFYQKQTRPHDAHHYLPVTTKGDMSVVPWESWVYTNIGEGIEITFTDEMGNGIYRYASIPDPPDEGSVEFDRYSQLVYYAPASIAARTIAEVPESYIPGGPMSGLGFSYDFADFRGIEGKTRLEVYYAIDPAEMGTAVSGDTSTIVAECAVVLADTGYARVYRTSDPILFRAIGHRRWPKGAFIPSVVSMNVSPGDYLLTVQVNDRVTDRKGLYRHRIHVEPYDKHGLQLSDVQLCWNISESGSDDKFRKDDIWVIPMPTRAYREGQSAYVYYELYNLTRNTFGETRFRITYTIAAEDPMRPFNLVRSSVGALARLFKRKDKAQVRVSFNQSGTDTDATGYFELSLKKVRAGYNRLTVTVEDLNSGQTTAKEITFRYKK